MRITIAQGAFLPVPPLLGGAVEKAWHALGREFARRGHEVTHVSRAFPGLPAEETDDAGVRHRRVRGHATPRSLAWLKALDLLYSGRVLRVLPPADVLVTNTFWLPILCRSRRWGARYVHVARFPRGQMRLYRHVEHLQTVSQPIAEAIRRIVPDVAQKISVVPYPLPPGMLLAGESEVAALASSRTPTVLFAGRIHPQKGLDLLVRAFAILRQMNPTWTLRFVGPWETALGGGGEDYRAELDRLAATLGVAVEWAGFAATAEALGAHLTAASVFVYPSVDEFGETFGLAPLEAMGSACPTVVSALECFGDFLREGKSGLVFDHRAPDAPERLATVLSRLAASPEDRARLGREGWLAAREFSLERVATKYLADFASAAEEASSSKPLGLSR